MTPLRKQLAEALQPFARLADLADEMPGRLGEDGVVLLSIGGAAADALRARSAPPAPRCGRWKNPRRRASLFPRTGENAMPRLKIRHLVAKPGRHGPRYFWQPASRLRPHGFRTVRLADDLSGAVAEAEAWNARLDAWRAGGGDAAAGRPAGAGATVSDLIRAYKASSHWSDLSPNSRRSYGHNIGIVEDWAGSEPAASIGRADVQNFYQAMRVATPSKAAAVARMIRILFGVGQLLGLVADNPGEKQKIRLTRAVTPEIWPHGAALAFATAADALGLHSVGDAVIAGEWLGHYASDLIGLRRENYVDGTFRFRRRKTGAAIVVPHSPAVAARFADALRRQQNAGVVSDYLILNEATGRPYADERSLAKKFRQVRDKVAETNPDYAGLWFMWLRHTAIVRLAEAGCTIPEIAAITGHSLKTVHAILEHYLAPTEEMAGNAVAKRLEYEAGKPARDRLKERPANERV